MTKRHGQNVETSHLFEMVNKQNKLTIRELKYLFHHFSHILYL